MTLSENDQKNSIETELNTKFAEIDLDVGFLKTPGKTESGHIETEIDYDADEKKIVAAFAYTLSRFTGRQDAVFSSYKNGIYYPHFVNCKNEETKKFIADVEKELEKTYGLGIKNNRQLPKEYLPLKEAVVSLEKIPQSKKISISLSCDNSEKPMKIKLRYSEKIGKKLAARFLKTVEIVLKKLSEDKTLGEIDYGIPEDIVALEKIHGRKNKLKYKSITEAFEIAVKNNLDKNCVQHKDARYTFKETDEITNGLADILAEGGVKKGDRVAFFVHRSEWYAFCIFGILKTGAAFVPIDEKTPDERISFMLSDAKCKAVFVSPETKERIANINFSGKIIDVSECRKKSFERVEVSGDDLAAIYYTSGSTGQPKGVMIPHIAFENTAEEPLVLPDLSPNNVKGLLSSIGFIINVMFILSTATMTTTVDIVPWECVSDMKKMDEYFRKNKIDSVQFTPRLAKAYLESVKDTTLYNIGFGGDAMCDIKPIKGKRMFVGYGMTECNSDISGAFLKDIIDLSSVGTVANNMCAYILDAEMRKVPIGGIGELCVSGMNVALGYTSSAQTKENFIDNPFSDEKYCKNMYKTGDLFRLLPDGSLGFVGRRDGIVKIRGNRVELGEVESAIKSIPSVENVAVVPIKNDKGETELCAYVVSEGNIDHSFVETHILKTKPGYMVPAFVIKVDKIPLTVNGKLNKNALPKPDLSQLRGRYVAPRNEAEKTLCGIMSEVLNIKKVGIDDDYVRLGGNSLNAVKVSSMFNSVDEKMHITTLDILRFHTVRKIVENCKAVTMEKLTYDFSKESPLVDAQTDMYTYMAEGKNVETNMTYLISHKMWDCAETAHKVLLKVIEAHPVLKSHVVKKNGTLWNSFDTMPEIKFYKEEPHALCPRVIRHFGLNDVLARFAITEWEGKTYVIADVSHLIFDGRSVIPLFTSFVKATLGMPLPLDDGLRRQYAYEAAYHKSDKFKKQYEKTMAELKTLDTNIRLPKIPEDEEQRRPAILPIEILPEQLDATANAFNTTVGTFAASVFGYTLAKFTNRDDAYFHFTQDGRDNVDLENSVGIYVRINTIVLPYKGEKCDAFVMNNLPRLYELMSTTSIPLWQLREKYDVWPNTLFQYQHFSKELKADENLMVEQIQIGPHFNSLFFVMYTEKGYVLYCSHNALHSHEMIENLGREFIKNLKEIVNETMKKDVV